MVWPALSRQKMKGAMDNPSHQVLILRKYQDALLDPTQCCVVIIDHQPQMYFGVEGMSRSELLSNTAALASAAKIFNVPCILTTVEALSFSGLIAEKLQQVYPQQVPIDRTCINAWEDASLKRAVEQTSMRKILIAGLWTEACVTFPALSMLEDGYDVFVVADCCAGASKEAHEMAMQRMIQSDAVPVTWEQVCLEWQRDWNNKDTYSAVMSLVKQYGGAYGLGVEYSETMLRPQTQQQKQQPYQGQSQQQAKTYANSAAGPSAGSGAPYGSPASSQQPGSFGPEQGKNAPSSSRPTYASSGTGAGSKRDEEGGKDKKDKF
jgi:nicotinamidase-related amidase